MWLIGEQLTPAYVCAMIVCSVLYVMYASRESFQCDY